MGAVNGATDIGKNRIDARIRLNSSLDISGINLRLTGGIGGTGGINSNLSGTLYLYDDSTNSVLTDTFTGGVNINSGNVAINADSELGPSTSTLTFNGGTLTTTLNITSSRAINLAGNGTIYSGDGSTINEAGVISGGGQLTLDGGEHFNWEPPTPIPDRPCFRRIAQLGDDFAYRIERLAEQWCKHAYLE